MADTGPDVTAAEPVDPPLPSSLFQGFRVSPKCSGSVVGKRPNSEVLVLASTINPALLKRRVSSLLALA